MNRDSVDVLAQKRLRGGDAARAGLLRRAARARGRRGVRARARPPQRAGVRGRGDATWSNSAGCGAALREAGRWLGGEGEALAAGAIDIASSSAREGLRGDLGRLTRASATTTPATWCTAQKVSDAPRRLLEQIPGLALIPHEDPASCCGAAGIYNLTHHEMSQRGARAKAAGARGGGSGSDRDRESGLLDAAAQRSGACRAARRGRAPVELLARAYFSSGSPRPSRRIL